MPNNPFNKINNPIFTCNGCPSRTPGCHGTCEKYIREREEYQRVKNEKKEDKETLGYITDSVRKNKDISAKKRHGFNWNRD